MSPPCDDLWQRIAAYHIGPADASLTFAARLARENRLSLAEAELVIEEYRRFCFLAVTAGHEVTPSDVVDQVWHLHLTYSRDYWEVFCPHVLQAELHHGPTSGGPVEAGRYYRQYAATLAAYEVAFGETPPTSIWPAAAKRFKLDPRGVRVNLSGIIVLSHRVALALGLLAAMVGWLVGRMM